MQRFISIVLIFSILAPSSWGSINPTGNIDDSNGNLTGTKVKSENIPLPNIDTSEAAKIKAAEDAKKKVATISNTTTGTLSVDQKPPKKEEDKDSQLLPPAPDVDLTKKPLLDAKGEPIKREEDSDTAAIQNAPAAKPKVARTILASAPMTMPSSTLAAPTSVFGTSTKDWKAMIWGATGVPQIITEPIEKAAPPKTKQEKSSILDPDLLGLGTVANDYIPTGFQSDIRRPGIGYGVFDLPVAQAAVRSDQEKVEVQQAAPPVTGNNDLIYDRNIANGRRINPNRDIAVAGPNSIPLGSRVRVCYDDKNCREYRIEEHSGRALPWGWGTTEALRKRDFPGSNPYAPKWTYQLIDDATAPVVRQPPAKRPQEAVGSDLLAGMVIDPKAPIRMITPKKREEQTGTPTNLTDEQVRALLLARLNKTFHPIGRNEEQAGLPITVPAITAPALAAAIGQTQQRPPEKKEEMTDEEFSRQAMAAPLPPDQKKKEECLAGAGCMGNPLGDQQIVVTSLKGERESPEGLGGSTNHAGADLRANKGQRVYAPVDGIVVRAGNCPGLGPCVQIKKNKKVGTEPDVFVALAHTAPNVTVGTRVRQGDEIAEIAGACRVCTAPHLHFQINIGNSDTRNRQTALDPILYLPNVQYKDDALQRLEAKRLKTRGIQAAPAATDNGDPPIPGAVLRAQGTTVANENGEIDQATAPGPYTVTRTRWVGRGRKRHQVTTTIQLSDVQDAACKIGHNCKTQYRTTGYVADGVMGSPLRDNYATLPMNFAAACKAGTGPCLGDKFIYRNQKTQQLTEGTYEDVGPVGSQYKAKVELSLKAYREAYGDTNLDAYKVALGNYPMQGQIYWMPHSAKKYPTLKARNDDLAAFYQQVIGNKPSKPKRTTEGATNVLPAGPVDANCAPYKSCDEKRKAAARAALLPQAAPASSDCPPYKSCAEKARATGGVFTIPPTAFAAPQAAPQKSRWQRLTEAASTFWASLWGSSNTSTDVPKARKDDHPDITAGNLTAGPVLAKPDCPANTSCPDKSTETRQDPPIFTLRVGPHANDTGANGVVGAPNQPVEATETGEFTSVAVPGGTMYYVPKNKRKLEPKGVLFAVPGCATTGKRCNGNVSRPSIEAYQGAVPNLIAQGWSVVIADHYRTSFGPKDYKLARTKLDIPADQQLLLSTAMHSAGHSGGNVTVRNFLDAGQPLYSVISLDAAEPLKNVKRLEEKGTKIEGFTSAYPNAAPKGVEIDKRVGHFNFQPCLVFWTMGSSCWTGEGVTMPRPDPRKNDKAIIQNDQFANTAPIVAPILAATAAKPKVNGTTVRELGLESLANTLPGMNNPRGRRALTGLQQFIDAHPNDFTGTDVAWLQDARGKHLFIIHRDKAPEAAVTILPGSASRILLTPGHGQRQKDTYRTSLGFAHAGTSLFRNTYGVMQLPIIGDNMDWNEVSRGVGFHSDRIRRGDKTVSNGCIHLPDARANQLMQELKGAPGLIYGGDNDPFPPVPTGPLLNGLSPRPAPRSTRHKRTEAEPGPNDTAVAANEFVQPQLPDALSPGNTKIATLDSATFAPVTNEDNTATASSSIVAPGSQFAATEVQPGSIEIYDWPFSPRSLPDPLRPGLRIGTPGNSLAT